METQKRTLSKRAEALALVFLLACLGALGLHAATQTTNFDPAAATVGNARLLTLAITQYAQDHDELLPPTQNVAVFQAALRPYVADPAVFVSRDTSQPFIPNPAISGHSLASFSDLYTTPVFRDTPPAAAPATVGFLDGHIELGGVVQDHQYNSSYTHARALSLAIIQYTQDYDEILPPSTTQVAFQTALLPYVHSPQPFIDPANGKPFLPNPALSGVSLGSIADPSTTIQFESAMPYKNGVPTIGYVDGHVTPKPVVTNPIYNLSYQDNLNLRKIGSATIQYEQDNNEYLPPTTDYMAFENALSPYITDTSTFVSPGSGLPYILNPAISGENINLISNFYATEEARDAKPNADGSFNHLELDGHVHQDLYFLPKSLVVSPADETHLLWLKTNQEAALWDFMPSDITKSTEMLNNSNAVGFSVGGDSLTRLLWKNNYYTGENDAPITGAITLDTLASDNTLSNETQFGPYDGWKTLFLTTGADNSSRLLWQRYDGVLALWTLSSEGNYVGYVSVPTLTDGTPVGMALGKDGLTRLLWKTSTGDALLWTLSANGTVLRSFSASSPHGFTLTGLGLDAGDSSRLLWGDGKDNAVVAAVSGVGGHFFFKEVSFTLPGGGTASQIAVGKAGDLRVLWENADGSGQLQTLTAGGKQTSDVSLTPYQ